MAEEFMSAGEQPEGASAEGGSEEAVNLFEQPPGTDWFIAFLIGFAEVAGLESGITLWVHGKIVTGTLISGRKYFAEMERTILSSSGNLTSDTIKYLAQEYGQFKELYHEPNLETPIHSLKPGYIHLKNARVIEADRAFPRPGTLWRCKLSSVDAFSVGEMILS